ncbi:hypothetical protein SLEP1_g45648 [Rubroshorea leprosula]|uniref:Uncharacterized protein n=1 Tax=Rubroshorea leprosula TaxID=152421 RepID=A0AAV5LKG4_9ROSI|nr:hypothetical protein SLEP1_g45648 [Rubroshorea leprosula]
MRGVGGPLLTIGDLLSDVGEESGAAPPEHLPSPPSPSSLELQPLDLTRLFQEDYDKLDKAFAGSDHSWTGLTLKLCSALETANKLVKSTDTNAGVLLEKVVELERIVKRTHSAIAAAKGIPICLNRKEGSSSLH